MTVLIDGYQWWEMVEGKRPILIDVKRPRKIETFHGDDTDDTIARQRLKGVREKGMTTAEY